MGVGGVEQLGTSGGEAANCMGVQKRGEDWG